MHPTHSFLFNADHPSFAGSYGDPCKSALVNRLLSVDEHGAVNTRILAGDILLTRTGLRADSVKAGTTIKYRHDGARVHEVMWDFCESIAGQWNTLDDEAFVTSLATATVYSVTLPTIDVEVCEELSARLESYAGYLGSACVDCGNPLQYDLLCRSLVDRLFIRDRSVFLLDTYTGTSPVNDEPWVQRSGFRRIVCLSESEYQHVAPPAAEEQSLSLRGAQTAGLLGRLRPTHRERVAESLFSARVPLRSHRTGVAEFSTSILSGVEDAIVPKEKLTEYVLSDTHTLGRHKAAFFRALLGFTASNWRELASQLVNGLGTAELHKVRGGPYGVQYHVDVPVVGANGATHLVRAAWIINSGEPARMVTAHIV